jgi:hypothetical protein
MNNNNENQQVDPILKNLQNIFSDRPEVLRLLDPSNLDLDRVAGEVVLENYRNQEGFSSPINLYVTGKTRAGKTSLGNTLLGGKQTAMKSTGYTDCTDKVNCFKLANNLRYFDLPGAGSDETFENINRAALCIEQIDEENCRVTEFILSDYTDYQNTKKAQEETISVEKWQSQDNQLELGADVILYVVAAHEGMGRDDEVYLGSLLYLQKEKRDSCNVIFALNLHLDENDRPMYRKQYIEDAYKRITKVYKKVYGDQNTEPIIIEINSIKGIGADKIAEEICKLLPVHKLGKMEEVLGEKLKEKARITRSKRFHEALIYIASRLATFKVDQSFNADYNVVLGSCLAVYNYSSRIFKKEVPIENNNDGIFDDISNEITGKRTQDKTIDKPIYDQQEKTRDVPKYGEIKETSDEIINVPISLPKSRENPFAQFFLGNEVVIVNQQQVVPKTKTTWGVIGMKQVSEGYTEVVVGHETIVVGREFLKGGYEIIEGILAIGLGFEGLPGGNLKSIYENGKKQVNLKIGNLKSKIEQIINNSDSKSAENEIISILRKTLL